MRKYVITFKIGEREKANCAVMTGNELARTYGFSDCTGIEVLKVWEVQADGNLIECEFGGSVEQPLNWIQIFNPVTMADSWYEWAEH